MTQKWVKSSDYEHMTEDHGKDFERWLNSKDDREELRNLIDRYLYDHNKGLIKESYHKFLHKLDSMSKKFAKMSL